MNECVNHYAFAMSGLHFEKNQKNLHKGVSPLAFFTPLQVDYQQIIQGETLLMGFHLYHRQDSFTYLLTFN